MKIFGYSFSSGKASRGRPHYINSHVRFGFVQNVSDVTFEFVRDGTNYIGLFPGGVRLDAIPLDAQKNKYYAGAYDINDPFSINICKNNDVQVSWKDKTIVSHRASFPSAHLLVYIYDLHQMHTRFTLYMEPQC